jgi:hypothetical protein
MNLRTTARTLFCATLLLSSLNGHAQSKYFDIAKNLEIFANAYREVNHSYVDQLDPTSSCDVAWMPC